VAKAESACEIVAKAESACEIVAKAESACEIVAKAEVAHDSGARLDQVRGPIGPNVLFMRGHQPVAGGIRRIS
jgi:hypothetical protein